MPSVQFAKPYDITTQLELFSQRKKKKTPDAFLIRPEEVSLIAHMTNYQHVEMVYKYALYTHINQSIKQQQLYRSCHLSG